MKLLVLLDTAQVYRLSRPTQAIGELMDTERCIVIDVKKETFFNPEVGDTEDILSDEDLLGLKEEEGEIEAEDEDVDLISYNDEDGYEDEY